MAQRRMVGAFARGLHSARTARAGGAPWGTEVNEPGGRLFGEKILAPGERRVPFDWELPYLGTLALASAMLFFGLPARPKKDINVRYRPTVACVRALRADADAAMMHARKLRCGADVGARGGARACREARGGRCGIAEPSGMRRFRRLRRLRRLQRRDFATTARFASKARCGYVCAVDFVNAVLSLMKNFNVGYTDG